MRSLDQSRDPDGLPALLERLESEFARVLTRFRIPAQDAEDLLQDLILTFLTQRSQIHSPDAWLMGTLRHGCALYWRKRRRRLIEAIDGAILEELGGGVEARQVREDIRRDLSRAIGRLPERCRSFIRLRYGLGFENPEVAEQLGYSSNSIRKISSRCLSALTDQILTPIAPLPPPATEEALENA